MNAPRATFGPRDLLAWLAEGNNARPTGPAPDNHAFSTVTMSSLPHGSPPMRPGGLFIAVRGERRDGHDFVADAFANGAVASLVHHVPDNLQEAAAHGEVTVLDARLASAAGSALAALPQSPVQSSPKLLLLVDDPMSCLQKCAAWWRLHQPASVLAITGSVGKTTTKDLLATILSARGSVLRTQGNLNNELGLPFMLLQLTPEHTHAVLEIGISHPGEMAVFARIAAPNVGIVTRVAPAHLEFFGSVDTVEREKGVLVETLDADGLAVLNADDPRVARMSLRTRARVLTYGLAEDADVRASDVALEGFTGVTFQLHYRGERRTVSVPLIGRHFATCALAAAAAAFEAGCSWDQVVAGLARPVEGRRIEPKVLPQGGLLLDDTYNASPAAVEAALDVLATCRGRRVAVLGDMLEFGESGPVWHQHVGAYAVGRTDYLLTVGPLGKEIARGARDHGFPPDRLEALDSNEDAIAWLAARLRDGDFVLVKGSRSMRMDTIVRALTHETTPSAH